MSTSAFENYEQDIRQLLNAIQTRLERLDDFQGEDRKAALKHCERDAEEAQQMVEQLDLECRMLPTAQRTEKMSIVRAFKDELDTVRKQIRNSQNAMSDASNRTELFGGRSLGEDSKSMADRERMMQSTRNAERGVEQLRDSRRVIQETEEVGMSIMQDLHGQRETLIRARDNLSTTNENISKSRQILKEMAKRLVRNKVLLITIISVLLITILLVVYFRYIADDGSDSSNSG